MPFQMGILMPWLVKTYGEGSVLRLGYIGTCSAYLAFFLVGSTTQGRLFYLCLFLFTGGYISVPMQQSMANRLVSRSELGRLSGAMSALETLGKMTAPLLA